MGNQTISEGGQIFVSRKAAATAETTAKEAVVYVGPSLAGIATRNTTYNNGLPEGLEKYIEKKPIMAKLLVPVSKLATALKEINSGTGAYAAYYKDAQKGE